MQIPYEVKPRPDTGLFNAKIGVWLFLASEVMLFGGLFSGYVFLRLGSAGEPDFFWPHGELNVWFGFINTLILILSSVFVVVAWLQLKLREYKKFQMWMIAVVVCAFVFLINKGFEYNSKLHHWGIKLTDNSIVHGHGVDDTIRYEGIQDVTIDVKRFNGEFLSRVVGDSVPKFQEVVEGKPTGDAMELTPGAIAKITKRINGELRKKVEAAGEKWFPAKAIGQLSFRATEPFAIEMSRAKLRTPGTDSAKFKDQSLLKGTISADTLGLKLDELDRIDLRAADGDSPEDALVWKHLTHGAEHAQKQFFAKRDEVVAAAQEEGEEPSFEKMFSQKVEHSKEHHTSILVPWEDVRLYSNFTPKWNTYYAIYFTLTGLHGLHVLLGALVLLYFGVCCKWLYDKDPEHLANRVEVGGLFWHFVDLVWIFLFPILYLM